jgi:hypothetical protein
MIGPVSGTGRAMMASLQQQMAKGMPPDQAIAYVKSMAQDGVAPLVDLYAMMKQFQRLKEQQVKPPQNPPTVRDQINALAQQGMPQQGQGMPQQGMAPPMEQGLGGMNAGPMENPSFAGGGTVGGIVAFADGGLNIPEIYGEGSLGQRDPAMLQKFGQAGSPEDLARMYALALSKKDVDTASRLEQYMERVGITRAEIDDIRRKTSEGLSAVGGALEAEEKEAARRKRKLAGFGVEEPVPQVPAPVQEVPPPPKSEPVRKIAKPAAASSAVAAAPEKDITEEQYSKLRDFRKREGLGAAREEYKKYLSDEEKRIADNYGRDKQLAFAEIGFKMAAAASRPGATFLGALSEGAMSGTQAMRAINKELNANKRALRESMIKLNEAAEMEKEGDYKTAMGLNKEARAEALELYKIREQLKADRERIAATREVAEAQREATQQSREEQRVITRTQLRERILSTSAYPMLEMQLGAEKDPEKRAQIQSQMDALMKQADARAGLASSETEQPAAGATKYRYDMQTGQMIPIG